MYALGTALYILGGIGIAFCVVLLPLVIVGAREPLVGGPIVIFVWATLVIPSAVFYIGGILIRRSERKKKQESTPPPPDQPGAE